MTFIVHNNADFEKGSRNKHFQSTRLVGREGGRVSQKEYSVYGLDNVDNSGQPLAV